MTLKRPKPEAKSVPTIYVRVTPMLKKEVAAACAAERRTEKEVVTAALREYIDRRLGVAP